MTTFAKDGYAFVPALLEAGELKDFGKWARAIQNSKRKMCDAGKFAGERTFYGLEITEILLGRFLKGVEEVTGQALYPSCSYLRIYKHGHDLKRHNDEFACEIGLSVCLALDGDRWPLHLATLDGTKSFPLASGDGLIYYGHKFEHWREPFTGSFCAQLLFFYVRKGGPYAHKRYDGRLGAVVHRDVRTQD